MNAQYKKGILELCVLKLIQRQDLYGYETVQKVSNYIEVRESTIYPLLRRLTKEGYLETYNKESTEGPMRKYYSMTVKGEGYLEDLLQEWYHMAESVGRLLKGAWWASEYFNQWLEELHRELQGISEEDRTEILDSYKEQINEMKQLNIKEEQILSKLG